MNTLNPLRFPLRGSSLIEASAGTGKTYTIVNLYLRLLLGHGCEPRSVEQILVVTFTNAATAELKTRIGERLRQVYADFYRAQSDDPFVQALMDEIADEAEDRQRALHRLTLALQQLDEASVFTIHGFCHRVLESYAFESNSPFGLEFVLDQHTFIEMAVKDFWRSRVNTLQGELLTATLGCFAHVEALINQVKPLVGRQFTFSVNTGLDQLSRELPDLLMEAQQLAKTWLAQDIAEQLKQADLKGNTKLGNNRDFIDKQQRGFAQLADLVPNRITFEAVNGIEWAVFSSENLQKATKKTSVLPENLDLESYAALGVKLNEWMANIKTALISEALAYTRQHSQQHKQQQGVIAPDDLLQQLANALDGNKGARLITAVQRNFPVCLIDEFQDTDPLQYQIFSSIYANHRHPATVENGLCFVMIGDPKQAIYAFRGADIFTYIAAKQAVKEDQHFNLASNWRSQKKLVEATNRLFLRRNSVFKFDRGIDFIPVEAQQAAAEVKLKGEPLAALNFHHYQPDSAEPVEPMLSWNEAQQPLAAHCAEQIVALLNDGEIITQQSSQTVQAKDICVLVRSRDEAALIKSELDARHVASVFLVRHSVFDSQSALDLLQLMRALAYPGQERHIKAALLSESFAFDQQELAQLLDDEWQWQQIQQQFGNWHRQCQQQSIMLVLNRVLEHFALAQKWICHYADGLRRFTDWRHLIELLQTQHDQVVDIFQLLLWLEQQVLDPDSAHESQQLRLEDDSKLVQIITQHASKGLEFPLVFIPFASHFRAAKQGLYHANNQLLLDVNNQSNSVALADQERMAEDIRLLYVAVTRAKYHCALGLWHNKKDKRSKRSEWYLTALGWLLTGEQQTLEPGAIEQAIAELGENADIGYQSFCQVGAGIFSQHLSHSQSGIAVAKLERAVKQHWRFSSYSALARNAERAEVELPGQDEGQDQAIARPLDIARLPDSPFTFDKGPQAGCFLHDVLEKLDFQHPQALPELIERFSLKYAIDHKWQPMLEQWIGDLLTAEWHSADHPLAGMKLQALQQRQAEMAFLLPLNKVDAAEFSAIINKAFNTSKRHYQFEQLSGMLKGFIDLTFCYKGCYYVADYKSNFLGFSAEDYQQNALVKAMQEHDYHLQAILYVLALHRYLKCKLPNYAYQKHIGGAYYLFLRAMHSRAAGQGVYHYLPDEKLIVQLDKLFSGESERGASGE